MITEIGGFHILGGFKVVTVYPTFSPYPDRKHKFQILLRHYIVVSPTDLEEIEVQLVG